MLEAIRDLSKRGDLKSIRTFVLDDIMNTVKLSPNDEKDVRELFGENPFRSVKYGRFSWQEK
jgi:hypothetical protein